MDYSNFLIAVSGERFSRYLSACGENKSRAMRLYRLNQVLSREMFSIVSCLEVGLRNRIDCFMSAAHGADWLRDSILPGGMFDRKTTQGTKKIIEKVYNEVSTKSHYAPSKMLSKMEFGIWKYMYAGPQYTASGRILLKVFPNKPTSTKILRYDNSFIFGELNEINELRNRIAHNEPICFMPNAAVKSTQYAKEMYEKMFQLLMWMDIETKPILKHINHVKLICRIIEHL